MIVSGDIGLGQKFHIMAIQEAVGYVSGILTDYVMVSVLLVAALFFTYITRGVQFRMAGEMLRLLMISGRRDNDTRKDDSPAHGTISSFQAFALSIASRVGTGNMAGVATAIALGGPGAVFWMWVIALLERRARLSSRHSRSFSRSRAISHLWVVLPIISRKVCTNAGGL